MQGLQSGGFLGSCFLQSSQFISFFNCQTSFVVVVYLFYYSLIYYIRKERRNALIVLLRRNQTSFRQNLCK